MVTEKRFRTSDDCKQKMSDYDLWSSSIHAVRKMDKTDWICPSICKVWWTGEELLCRWVYR